MSKCIDHGNPKMKLRLNLSSFVSPDSSPSSSAVKANSTDTASGKTTMDDSSCLSSEPEDAEITSRNNNRVVGSSSNNKQLVEGSNGGDDDGGMVLVGCPRCLMYVILSELNLKCPICKSSVLLDLLTEVKNWSTK